MFEYTKLNDTQFGVGTTPLTEDSPTETNEELSLEALVLLLHTQRLTELKEKTAKELKELKDRQTKVSELHDILRSINAATDSSGNLDLSKNPELKQKIEKLKALGVETKDGQTSFNKDETDRLVENVRITVEDLNIENDMQLQSVSRLTSERFESYQMARSIFKPLHEAKSSHARAMRGS